MVKAVKKGMRGECPVAGAGAPGSGAPRILFLTAFTIDFLRFAGHFSCPVWVLRRDSFWGRVWYGLPTNLPLPRSLRHYQSAQDSTTEFTLADKLDDSTLNASLDAVRGPSFRPIPLAPSSVPVAHDELREGSNAVPQTGCAKLEFQKKTPKGMPVD